MDAGTDLGHRRAAAWLGQRVAEGLVVLGQIVDVHQDLRDVELGRLELQHVTRVRLDPLDARRVARRAGQARYHREWRFFCRPCLVLAEEAILRRLEVRLGARL